MVRTGARRRAGHIPCDDGRRGPRDRGPQSRHVGRLYDARRSTGGASRRGRRDGVPVRHDIYVELRLALASRIKSHQPARLVPSPRVGGGVRSTDGVAVDRRHRGHGPRGGSLAVASIGHLRSPDGHGPLFRVRAGTHRRSSRGRGDAGAERAGTVGLWRGRGGRDRGDGPSSRGSVERASRRSAP